MVPCVEASEISPWVALVVRPRAERRVQAGLSNAGLENFVPWYGVRRRWSDRIKVLERNLFPGYVFCQSTFDERLVVMRQPGVEWVVSFNRTPALIPDREIAVLRSAIDSGLPLGPWPFLKAGQRVRIQHGVLAGIEGLLARDSAAWRVAVSVNALQRSVAIEVDRDMICPVGESRERRTEATEPYSCSQRC
jgi:transcription termination/antitermination protein NusG